MKTLTDAWNSLQIVLNKKEELEKEYAAKLVNLNVLEENLREFISKSEDTLPNVEFDERIPFESWKVSHADIDKAVLAFRTLRDQITKSNKQASTFESEMKELQQMIGNWLLQLSNEQNVNSFKTQSGTAYRQLKVRASAANWDKFVEWASQNDAADALFKRINTGFVKAFQEDNNGEVPPYLNVDREYEIVVRKS